MRFGRQRSPREVVSIALLLVGFVALAVAFWIYTSNWAGALLPVGFLIALFGSFRAEVKEIELRGDTLILRTFFRSYPIPRAHVTGVVLTPRGAAIEVLNGNRYDVTPPDTNPDAVARALTAWLHVSSDVSSR